jgi:hypothetical protein
MSITVSHTKRVTRINVTGADALDFLSRMIQPISVQTHKSAVLSVFDDLTAAARRQRLTSTPTVRTSARAAL